MTTTTITTTTIRKHIYTNLHRWIFVVRCLPGGHFDCQNSETPNVGFLIVALLRLFVGEGKVSLPRNNQRKTIGRSGKATDTTLHSRALRRFRKDNKFSMDNKYLVNIGTIK